MTEVSRNLEVKPKPASPAFNPPTALPSAQLAATTDPSSHNCLVSLGNHVARADTRLTTIENVLTHHSGEVTTFMALDPRAPQDSSSNLSTIDNQLASTPGKLRAPFCTSSQAPLPPRKRLNAPAGSNTTDAKLPESAAQARSPAASALKAASESSFHERWNLSANKIYYRFA